MGYELRFTSGEMTRRALLVTLDAIVAKRCPDMAALSKVDPVSPSDAWPASVGGPHGNDPAQDEVQHGPRHEAKRLGQGKEPATVRGLIEQGKGWCRHANECTGDEGTDEAPGQPPQAKFRDAGGQTPDAPGDEDGR